MLEFKGAVDFGLVVESVFNEETGLLLDCDFGDRRFEDFFADGILFFLTRDPDCGLFGFGFANIVSDDFIPSSNSFKFIL